MPILLVGSRLARASSLHAVAHGSVRRTYAGAGAMHPSYWRHVLDPSRRYNSTRRVAPSVSSSARASLRIRANGEQEQFPFRPPNPTHHGSKSSDPCSYLIKPREPTVLSHKEYHELSSTNLLLALVVRPPIPNDMSRSYANPWSCGIVFDCSHNPRALGCRKVQYRTGRDVVELSASRGKTG